MNAAMEARKLRRRLYLHLEPSATPGSGLTVVNRAVAALIILSVATAILETERTLTEGKESLFAWMEYLFTAVFAMEYCVRLWVCVEDGRYRQPVRGRLRYVRTPSALLDLLALAPILLSVGGSEAFTLRLFRFARILRIARLGRFSQAMQDIGEAVRSRQYELLLSSGLALLLVVVSSTLLYVLEGPDQPETFGSIPRAMWWSVVTLTTVGYGDVYPTTALGKMSAAVTAFAGIGLIAMPTGIVAAAFSEAIQRRKPEDDGPP